MAGIITDVGIKFRVPFDFGREVVKSEFPDLLSGDKADVERCRYFSRFIAVSK